MPTSVIFPHFSLFFPTSFPAAEFSCMTVVGVPVQLMMTAGPSPPAGLLQQSASAALDLQEADHMRGK